MALPMTPLGVTHGAARDAFAPGGRGLRALVVEDTLDHAEMIRVMLLRAGLWEVETAEQLAEAQARLSRGGIDVVLLDLTLPDSKGTDTVSRLCDHAPESAVVVVTSVDDEAVGLEAVRRGAQDFLVKSQLESAALTRRLRLAIERKRGEVAVSRLAAIVETTEDAVIALGLDGAIRTWNKGAEHLYGWTAEEALGRSIDIIVPPDRLEEARELYQRAGKGIAAVSFETVRRRRDSTPVDVSLTICPTRDHTGRITGAASIARDITGWRRMQEALKTSESSAQAVLDGALDAVIGIDEQGHITLWNPRAESMFGWSRAEALGHELAELIIPPDQRDAHRRGLTNYLKTGKGPVLGQRLEVEALRRDGTPLPVELVVTPLPAGGRHVAAAFLEDITGRRRAQEVEAQLLQSQKLEAVGRLAGGVAHDFNNLIGVIRGYAELALRPLAADDPVQARLSEIVKAADRAADLTRQLLAFSRKQPLQPRLLHLNRTVREMEDMLCRSLGEDVQVVTLLDEDLGHVLADPVQISQIILNLAVNARDAMPEGGRLLVETSNAELGPEYAAQHAGVRPGPYVMLAVTDVGIGMSREVLERIFEPFFTTKEDGKGTGLGMATVHGIVRQSDGHIYVYSEPGRGTTVKVYLPRADQASEGLEADEPDEALSAQPAPGGSETVLLVEDDPALRQLIREVLEGAGYSVLAAERGEEAMELANQALSFDLLVTDVVMPGMTGRTLADRLAPDHPGLRVLYMSGYTQAGVEAQEGFTPGMLLLQKPFTTDALLHGVRAALQQRGV